MNTAIQIGNSYIHKCGAAEAALRQHRDSAADILVAHIYATDQEAGERLWVALEG